MRFFLRYIFKYNVFGYLCITIVILSNILLYVSKSPYFMYIIISPATLFGIYQFLRIAFSYKRKLRFYNLSLKVCLDRKEIPIEWKNDPCYAIILHDAILDSQKIKR